MSNTKMQLVDWLDDLCVRFIINLPREELESVERICFQVEEAQWFYEDFIRPLDPALPSLNLQTFSLRIFQHCPLLSQWSHYHHMTAFQEFLAYKKRVPVRGAIMLNDAMDEVVLVKGWKKGANWSFPRGKINKDEKDLDCAVREVYEETGFDIRGAGLVDENNTKHIDFTIREQDMRLFVFRGVPKDTHFEPKTRKEISKIEWYKLTDLPTMKKNRHQEGDGESLVINANKFYMVAPFLHSLKKWIALQKKLDAKSANAAASADEGFAGEVVTPVVNQLAIPEEIMANIPSDLPELSLLNQGQGQQDASAHLKRLLNINSIDSSQIASSKLTDTAKSSALLDLLRKVDTPSTPAPPPPQTPMEQMLAAPTVAPRPPHHQHPHLEPKQHFTPPPQFPPIEKMPNGTQPNFPQQFPQQQSGYGFPPGNGPRYPNQRHMQPGPPFPIQAAENRSPFQPSNNTPFAQGMAPFHRTGDPEFAQGPGQASQQGSFVPPANKLPPPKLNNHTLSLLNAFKGVNKQKSPASGMSNPPQQGIMASFATSQQPPIATSSPVQPTQAQRPPSQHQSTLLDIFRKSSIPSSPAQTSIPSTTVRKEPVELSATTSPSKAHPGPVGFPQTPEKGLVPGQIKLLQRQGPRTAPVADSQTSATLSGPLNTPRFDAVQNPRKTPSQKRSGPANKVKVANGTLNDEATAQLQIFPRRQVPGSPAQQQTPPRIRTPRGAAQKKAVEPTKPFQPQILRRPVQSESGLVVIPNGLATPSADMSLQKPSLNELKPITSFDRRSSQTESNKQALLSLFGKPAEQSQPQPQPTAAFSNPVSPASMLKSPQSQSSIISPLNDSAPVSGAEQVGGSTGRARIGSLNSVTEGGSRSSATAKPTTPVDKAFLLGYLNRVTNK